jgi:hypothetical protein
MDGTKVQKARAIDSVHFGVPKISSKREEVKVGWIKLHARETTVRNFGYDLVVKGDVTHKNVWKSSQCYSQDSNQISH